MKYIFIKSSCSVESDDLVEFDLSILTGEEAREKLHQLQKSGEIEYNPEYYGGFLFDDGCIVRDRDSFHKATMVGKYEIPIFQGDYIVDVLDALDENEDELTD